MTISGQKYEIELTTIQTQTVVVNKAIVITVKKTKKLNLVCVMFFHLLRQNSELDNADKFEILFRLVTCLRVYCRCVLSEDFCANMLSTNLLEIDTGFAMQLAMIDE